MERGYACTLNSDSRFMGRSLAQSSFIRTSPNGDLIWQSTIFVCYHICIYFCEYRNLYTAISSLVGASFFRPGKGV